LELQKEGRMKIEEVQPTKNIINSE
jgi:hypothetical protein